MKIKEAYEKAIEAIRYDAEAAKSEFEYVLTMIGSKSLAAYSPDELRIYALSNAELFIISKFADAEKAEKAVEAFELYFETTKDDIKAYEAYILTLELSYRYERAKAALMTLLEREPTRKTALKFLSSYAYVAEGLQSSEECATYKAELISLSNDPDEIRSLQGELDSMNNL